MSDEIVVKQSPAVESTVSEDSSFDAKKKNMRRRRKIVQNLKCPLCESGVKTVTYKDVYQLKKFTSVRGKIISVEKSGACHRHQKMLKRAIKRARFMSLLPYSSNE
ncbi:MAG: 30S ribosomal protein S18 [candidate division WS6 bacterium GW2011_GWC1_36_11]|uniref:Small ribosomal subunit protein bS18 n=3 Tax=Candidatus Dojkabacteria TaxID=74243 RepID=A0A0G0GKJ6_9BACT|nr:MAG: 30S ribosomal protein S18 [candidate division WS6 bacterium GW2011_GWC1_36_11]KKQ12100.1 MAG: 30S ribosomal protein S18 [candidate division WS6 bacterium GW2011_GWC2_36_7]KKQ17527.1 MAG: 30S ribosomal protein S18 [candidate division WS6 bacterium GW2011_GWF1_36_8]